MTHITSSLLAVLELGDWASAVKWGKGKGENPLQEELKPYHKNYNKSKDVPDYLTAMDISLSPCGI